MKCALCEDCGWVCENHPDRPWSGDHACTCGGAGEPCPRCNPTEDGECRDHRRVQDRIRQEGLAPLGTRSAKFGQSEPNQCGNLYSIPPNQAAILALFRVTNRYVDNLAPMPGVFPDYPAPVACNAGSEREMVLPQSAQPA
jgi:hypothetical protein